MRMSRVFTCALILVLVLTGGASLTFPAQASEIDSSESEVRGLIERYAVDRGSLSRTYTVTISPVRARRFKQFYTDHLASLAKLDFDRMSQAGKVDYLLFKNHLQHEL